MRCLLFLLLLISSVTYSQSNVDFRGDSARFYKNGGSMEVIIRNSTKDSTNGVLTNIGNGITRFLKFRVSNDSLFLGNTFIGLIGGGGDSTVLNFDLPPAYIIVDGDTVDINVREWVLDYLTDTLDLNIVLLTEGASGDSLIRVQNDSLIQRRLRDSVFIVSSIASDGGRVTRLDTASARSWIGQIVKDTTVQPNTYVPFSNGTKLVSAQNLVFDTSANGLLSKRFNVGLNNTLNLFRAERVEGASTWSLSLQGIVNSGNTERQVSLTAANALYLNLNNPGAFIRSNQTHLFSSDVRVSNADGISSTGSIPFRIGISATANPGVMTMRGQGNLLSSTSNFIYSLDGEGRVTIGEHADFNARNLTGALEVLSDKGGVILPRMRKGQVDSLGGIKSVYITGTMTGYDGTSTISFSGGGGSGATATLTTSGGVITKVNMTNFGFGYTSNPTVTFGGAGSGAIANVFVDTVVGGTLVYARDSAFVLMRQRQAWSGFRWNNTINKYQAYNTSNNEVVEVFSGLSGTATLSSGTVTVNTTAVKATSRILVSCNTPSGTQGFLSAPSGSIVAGTSFVINSSNAGDNSTVYWVIIH